MSVEPGNGDQSQPSDAVVALLTKLTELAEKQLSATQGQNELARHRTEATASLTVYSAKTAEHASTQTDMARERTALTREQTRLSTRGTELANIRTQLAQQRTNQADERTRLAAQRTDMALRRTSLSDVRTRLAERRNDLALDRTIIARTRTHLSLLRTELARERTSLALIRTGLAFLALSIMFFRYFGLSKWTAFDVGLLVFSAIVVYYGVRGHRRSSAEEKRLLAELANDPGMPRPLAAEKPRLTEAQREVQRL